MMNTPHESFKETLGHLWANKPLFFTVIAGLAVVGFILYKNSNSAVIAPGTSPDASGTPGLNGGTYTNTSTIINTTTTTQPPSPIPVPGQPAGTPGKDYGLIPFGT